MVAHASKTWYSLAEVEEVAMEDIRKHLNEIRDEIDQIRGRL